MLQVKQHFHLGEKSFHPTPNVRTTAMMTEAEAFARHVYSWKVLLVKYERTLSGAALDSSEVVLF